MVYKFKYIEEELKCMYKEEFQINVYIKIQIPQIVGMSRYRTRMFALLVLNIVHLVKAFCFILCFVEGGCTRNINTINPDFR